MDVQTVNANVSRVPFFRFLNFEVRSLDSLHAEAEMTFDDRHMSVTRSWSTTMAA